MANQSRYVAPNFTDSPALGMSDNNLSNANLPNQAHNLKVVSSNLAPATKIKPAVSMR